MEGLQEVLAGQKTGNGEVKHVLSLVINVVLREALGIAEWLAEKEDGELFGQTEFELRDRLHSLGSRVIEAALEARKKGGTKGVA